MKQTILDTISDLCSDFLYYDRKEDEDLTMEQLNEAVKSGEITIDKIMSKEMRKYIDYGELIPDKIVDTFYDRIKDKIEHDENYEHYVRNLLKINGGKLPTKIENLINGL